MYVAHAEKDKETRFRNLPAVFICARIVYLPSVAVGISTTVFPGFLRAILLPLRSIILPGLVLPSLALVSPHGLRGFRRQSTHQVEDDLGIWGALTLSFLVEALATDNTQG